MWLGRNRIKRLRQLAQWNIEGARDVTGGVLVDLSHIKNDCVAQRLQFVDINFGPGHLLHRSGLIWVQKVRR